MPLHETNRMIGTRELSPQHRPGRMASSGRARLPDPPGPTPLARIGKVLVPLLAGLLGFAGQAAAQVAFPPPPSPSVVVGDPSAAATVTSPGGRVLETARLQGGVFRLTLGIPRKEVNRLLGNAFYTSLLEKAGVLAFDNQGRLIRGPAAGGEGAATEEGDPSWLPSGPSEHPGPGWRRPEARIGP